MKSSAPTARAASRISSSEASGPAEGDVLAHGAAEQEALLGHDPHLRAQRVRRHERRSWPSTSTRALGGVVEAGHELGERRLAGAGLADQRDRLAGRDREVDVAQRPRAVLVVGPYRNETSSKRSSPRIRRQLDGVRGVDELGLLVEQPEDLVERRHPRLVGRVELRELLDRVEEVVERGDERRTRRRSRCGR